MAVLYATGFETGSVAGINSGVFLPDGTFPTITSAAGTTHVDPDGVGSGYALNFETTSTGGTYSFLPNTARWLHAWFKPKTGFNVFRVAVAQGGSLQAMVQFSSAGTVTIYRGNTSVASAVGAFDASAAHWVAIFFDCRESPDGRIEVWIDGVNVLNFSGDTRNTTTDQWDAFGFGFTPYGAAAATAAHYLDDIVVTDATTGRLRELYGCAIRPDGAGSATGLTPSAGANWQNVDEAPPNDADYNTASASGQEDLYTLQDAPSASYIGFVNLCGRFARSGSINRAELVVKSGGTTDYGTADPLVGSPSYLLSQGIWEQDPNTGADWNQAGVDALQAGARFTAV